jgi:hypothetical protein
MSFANKPNRPDSKDTARLRAEYDKKAAEFQDSRDPATKAKLKDEKQKAFQRVVAQMNGERAQQIGETRKALASLGRYKTDAQMKEEAAKAESGRASRIAGENRV